MADVAVVAGVSHQTVSRVLNHPDQVSPATRTRVEAAIVQLGFRRNLAARALVTRSTQLIGVVSPGEARFGPSSMTVALEEAARLRRYATVLTVVREPSGVDEAVEHFLTLGADGIAVVPPPQPVLAPAIELAERLPVVAVASDVTAPGITVVGVDQAAGARLATEQLIGAGYTRIAHVTGPLDWFDARARMAGWRAALESAGLPVPELAVGGWDAADGYRAARELFARDERPDAVVAANDLAALGVLRACAEAGIRVPGELGLTGYDDIEGADHFVPALTSVRQPFEEVGLAAIAALMERMDGASPASVVCVPTLTVRESSHRH